MPEEQMVEQVPTPAQPTQEEVVKEPQQQGDNSQPEMNQPQPKLYTKEDVTKYIIQKGERVKAAICKKFGVKSLDELEEMKNNHISREEELSRINLENADLKREIAFLKNSIDPNRYDDVKAYFKGTDTDLTEESLIEALKNHPEWLKKEVKQTTITAVGRDNGNQETENDLKEVRALFGLR